MDKSLIKNLQLIVSSLMYILSLITVFIGEDVQMGIFMVLGAILIVIWSQTNA